VVTQELEQKKNDIAARVGAAVEILRQHKQAITYEAPYHPNSSGSHFRWSRVCSGCARLCSQRLHYHPACRPFLEP
jgi:hypothetical protein